MDTPETQPDDSTQVPLVPEYNYDKPALSADEIHGQVQLIQQVMRAVMQEGYHYGVIPGTEKPTLLKPGAEKLITTFRLAPLLHVELRDLGNGHREYQVRCTLVHIPTGKVYGEGLGSCSTMETKYRYRNSKLTCPFCHQETIIKGRAEYGGGYLCFQRKGGCGAKFSMNDKAITSQSIGRIENTDLADTWNTVLKMAKKRALVDATLTATAASDCFTQDLEDFQSEPAVPAPTQDLPPAAGGKPGRASESAFDQAPRVEDENNVHMDSLKTESKNTRTITKGQYDILALSCRRSKVPEKDLMLHLAEHYRIDALKNLRQADMNAVLEWIEAQDQSRRLAEEATI